MMGEKIKIKSHMTVLNSSQDLKLGCIRYKNDRRSVNLPFQSTNAHPAKRYSPSSRRSNYIRVTHLRRGVDQTENVVEHEVAAGAVGLELEALGVVHGLLLLVDLFMMRVSGVPG